MPTKQTENEFQRIHGFQVATNQMFSSQAKETKKFPPRLSWRSITMYLIVWHFIAAGTAKEHAELSR